MNLLVLSDLLHSLIRLMNQCRFYVVFPLSSKSTVHVNFRVLCGPEISKYLLNKLGRYNYLIIHSMFRFVEFIMFSLLLSIPMKGKFRKLYMHVIIFFFQ